MATFELYRRSTIGMCLTETLDEMVSSGTLSPELAIQVLVQFDKSMTDALENQVKSKVNIKLHPWKEFFHSPLPYSLGSSIYVAVSGGNLRNCPALLFCPNHSVILDVILISLCILISCINCCSGDCIRGHYGCDVSQTAILAVCHKTPKFQLLMFYSKGSDSYIKKVIQF
ncbi:uncharacterized protein LOC101754167 isoform X1 [Setaria italica]|uniref:uncharacterized protein LOC101754167 isoform X1 n=1 Tax=Setaria italica TaxID=4555 RepID=UPI000BE5E51F|nr:uncharacterized protein LOC101754167 isoform X1 [Setaria italica]